MKREVQPMFQPIWTGENRRMTVCVDSYESNVLKGRLYKAYREMECFDSLMQLLLCIQTVLEDQKMPQSYTAIRKFSDRVSVGEGVVAEQGIRKGNMATFEVQILFRQHSSWQGIVLWRERQSEQTFRSVLELMLLMDSALRSMAA